MRLVLMMVLFSDDKTKQNSLGLMQYFGVIFFHPSQNRLI